MATNASVHAGDLSLPPPAEGAAEVAARVGTDRPARTKAPRTNAPGTSAPGTNAPRTNAEADGRLLEEVAAPDAVGRRLLTEAARCA